MQEVRALIDGASALEEMPLGQPASFDAQPPALASFGVAEAENELRSLTRAGYRVLVCFPHLGEARRTHLQLRRVEAALPDPGAGGPDEPGVAFCVAQLRRGFVAPGLRLAVLPSAQLFRRRGARGPARIGRALATVADLRTGDYVVHEDHGVGRFVRFDTKEVGGVVRDYLYLEFRGDDRLYVPHDQLAKVSRYVGADGRAPALAKLGGKAWQTLKSRARIAVRELAGELIALYARRQSATKPPHGSDDEWMGRLEASFPYEETDDQETAIDVVKEDMESDRPMDRLVCGDVGFGKTEVAVRAAFKAASAGRQVLMLVPTTILAQQHAATFKDRFRDFPIRVEMVSRFRPPAEVKRVLQEYKDGKVEVLIGTHRVLSRDVVPQNLGLVIVDEEQRFGVAQKELLRQLRLEVDVLAMSATPIPRTLHMSLSGLRDITVITTPPRGRHPIKTHVGEFDEELITAALRREAGREGQSFYLHNRVETIDEAAERVRQWVPELRVGVAHGQMPERRLEDVMMKFLHGDFDVLVSTTIIESGLDIPQANTLVVERADTLGLAQLYQIRGRVGRSDEHAHAYLFYPDRRELSEEARHRLSTLADYTELGSGYRIAMRDLELRGAGNLLGDEQSGHVAAVGFELYCELLAEAVAELQGRPSEAARPVRLDAAVDAYVPADYVPLEAVKIDLHRRIALAGERAELRELDAELTDRFGPVPEPVGNLLAASGGATGGGRARRGDPHDAWRPDDGGAAHAHLRTGRRAQAGGAERPLHRRAPRGYETRIGRLTGARNPRCYTRNPPRSCGLIVDGPSPPHPPPGRSGGRFRRLWRRGRQLDLVGQTRQRRRGRRRDDAHHEVAARPRDHASGEGHDVVEADTAQGRDDRLHDQRRPADPSAPGAGRRGAKHRDGTPRDSHSGRRPEGDHGLGHAVLRRQPVEVPGRRRPLRPDRSRPQL